AVRADAALREPGRQGHERSGRGEQGSEDGSAARQRRPEHLGDGDRPDDGAQLELPRRADRAVRCRRRDRTPAERLRVRHPRAGGCPPESRRDGARPLPLDEGGPGRLASSRHLAPAKGSSGSPSPWLTEAYVATSSDRSPWAIACRTSSARVESPSFCMMCARCVSAVRTEMYSCFAISWFVWPSASRRSTSCSRSESGFSSARRSVSASAAISRAPSSGLTYRPPPATSRTAATTSASAASLST